MQHAGLEWAFRTAQEPSRLGWRYLMTNPHAMWRMLVDSEALTPSPVGGWPLPMHNDATGRSTSVGATRWARGGRAARDRSIVVCGKSVSVSVVIGCPRNLQKHI